MKKKIIAFIFVLSLCFSNMLSVFAGAVSPRLVDDADLLTYSEEKTLLQKLDEISERQGLDIVVVTKNSINGKTPMEYADDYYDYNGYNADGILLLISMEERDWWMSTSGYGITAFTDAGQEYMSDKFVGDLSNEYYFDAFTTFADLCDVFITQAKTGNPYDTWNLPKEPFNAVQSLIIAIAIGFIVALIITGIMKGKLKTVHSQPAAGNYVKNNSLHITESRELFLYAHINRVKKPTNNSGGSRTHTSSSGSSHGGRGGKF